MMRLFLFSNSVLRGTAKETDLNSTLTKTTRLTVKRGTWYNSTVEYDQYLNGGVGFRKYESKLSHVNKYRNKERY